MTLALLPPPWGRAGSTAGRLSCPTGGSSSSAPYRGIDPALLPKLLRYAPETGRFFWLERDASWFPSEGLATWWNSNFAGAEVFTRTDRAGYPRGTILARKVKAHIVAWAMMTGAWPEHFIDHADGDPANNRWRNLRAADRPQNAQNARRASGRASKYRGVSWRESDQTWQATIKIDGKTKFLGRFDTDLEAAQAYDVASLQHHGSFGLRNEVQG